MTRSSSSPTTPPPLSSRLATLIARRVPGCSLEGLFFHDEELYREELDRIWRRRWLFAGHSCEIAAPGDYLRYDLDRDSLIVIRGDNGEARAFHNVCRHRGTLIVRDESGTAGRLVCPYHQWTYGRDGGLLSCRGMEADTDRSRLGLVPAHLREVEGLLFICLAERPPDFEAARAQLSAMLAVQGLGHAKVAKSITYEVRANWKLVWENNRECYHCNANHPQYIRANFDHYNEDDTSERVRRSMDAAVARSHEKWRSCGLAVTHEQTGMTRFPDAENDGWYSANRTPLVDGYVTESMDGAQVAPLMGDYSEADVGTLRIRTVPSFWNHSSCDHGVSTRVTPAGPRRTLVRVDWLVDAGAVEGRDYELERLLPFWQLTSEQDWELCEAAQRGVESSAYTPGPYSRYKEYNVEAFVRWYLARMLGDEVTA